MSDANNLTPLDPTRTLTILDGSNPILKEVCQPVEEITPLFKRLSLDMLHTLLQSKDGGVGLSAPQVGISVRLVVMAIPGKRPEILFNPVVANRSKSVLTKQEGCLSFPGKVRNITRSKWVSVKYTDLSGRPVRRKYFGLEAVCVQHELDHLEGKLFTERGTSSQPLSYGQTVSL